MAHTGPSLETIVSFCKRRGFVYPAADVYGGLNGVYDIGPLGTLLKNNIRTSWLQSLDTIHGDILMLEGSLLGPHVQWDGSGHVKNFHDPMVDCTQCKHRFRADEIDMKKGCPQCGAQKWTDIHEFNMMFKTTIGARADSANHAYLRPETAQSIFTQFKNIMSSNRVKIPFGVAQIGKAFRNEITPKHFLFRVREFEQMELEWFCKQSDARAYFDFWSSVRIEHLQFLGLSPDSLRVHKQTPEERAHYSSACNDIEYKFPFGWKELEGIAHRGDYDLKAHSAHAKKDLSVFDDETKESYVPHVIETSIGTDRLFLALICDAYTEDEVGGESRIVLTFKPSIAPVKVAFMPLVKKLSDLPEKLYRHTKARGITCQFDGSGSIGKRYRRQDEIGTPLCVTYDFDSEQDNCVTIRHRDDTTQKRITIDSLDHYIDTYLNS